MERRSAYSGIGFRLTFFLVALCVLIGGSGGYTILRFQSVIAPLEREIPDVLQELDRTQRLSEIASTIRYFDELLSHSVHNFIFTGEEIWEQRYHGYRPQLDQSIQEALSLSNEPERATFESVASGAEALLDRQTAAIRLAKNGDAAGAEEILRSESYLNAKYRLEKSITDYFLNFAGDRHAALVSVRIASSYANENLRTTITAVTSAVVLSLILVALAALMIGRGIVAPINRLTEFAGRLAEGDLGVRIETRISRSKDEIGTLARAFELMARNIAESQAKLRESEERFRNLVEGSIEGIMIHRGFKPLFVNDAFVKIFGFDSREEVLALDSVLELAPPHVAARFKDYAAARLRGGDAPTRYEYEGVRKDGSMIWLRNAVRVVSWMDEPAIQSIVVDITERKRAEAALRDSEERLKGFAEAASDWYWEQDADLRFTSAYPPAAHKKTGVTAVELVGKTRRDIISLGVTEEQWRRHDADQAARRPFRDFTFQRRDPSGKLRDFSLDGKPVFDAEGRFKGYRGVGRDITERKRAEAALHRLGMAFEAVSEMIILYDAEDRLIHFNEAFREMNREVEKSITPGMTSEEVMRTMIAKGLLPEAVGREAAWLRERLERHKNPGDPVEIARQDGIWLLTHEQRLPDGGTIIISQNITERKRAEEQVKRLNAELEQRVEERTAELHAAQEQLLRKSRLAALGQLTGTVSHELRNPLGALRIAIAAVDKMLPEAPPALTRTLAIANRSVSRCDEIITDLLEYSRARALDRSDVALDDWLSGVLDEIEVPAGVTVSHALDCGLALAFDPERLRRAVLNVVENACQAMTPEDDDAVPAEDSDRRLSVATRTTGARVEICVHDTGPGIDEATLAKVFEPLFSTKSFGVGLGMTVVEQIMEQHGGGIEIDSAPGRGTEVVLWLPLPEPARRAAS